jgi:hypothetical protein
MRRSGDGLVPGFCPDICLERLRNTEIIQSQDSQRPRRDYNPIPPDLKSEISPFMPANTALKEAMTATNLLV